ncbi:hypothetical protein [Baaleninema sp.]|uniref:F0F1 ATP synthase subunit B family protein n=1 Tax=Baaleninema sp. TaxID=3101197 RepID=UPI003CFEF2B2
MLIDWFTVVAQLFNFLLLVWLLKRVLYRPVLRAIDRRQQRINQWYRDAEQQRKEAQENAERYRQQCRELQERKAKQLEDAKDAARREREKLTHQAKEEVDRLQRQWKTSLRRRQNQFFDRLQQETTHHLGVMTRRVLNDIADAQLEERSIERFLDRLHHLDDTTRSQLHEAIADKGASILICTEFEIPRESRDRILETVRQELASEVEIRESDDLFEENFSETESSEESDRNSHRDSSDNDSSKNDDPDNQPRPVPLKFVRDRAPICGIELYAGGYEVAWSFDRYLQELENRVRQTLEQQIDGAEEDEILPEERLRRQLTQKTYDIARRALQDIANETLEQQAISVFLHRWERLDDEVREQLARSLSEGDRSICVRSSFEISPHWKQKIQQHIQHQLSDRLPGDISIDRSSIDFQQASDLICGIEVQIDGREIAWNLDDYLDRVRDEVM